MADINCEILDTYIEFPAEPGSKFHKELNLVKWGRNQPKYDIRGWSYDRSEMTKGITLTKEELNILAEELQRIKL